MPATTKPSRDEARRTKLSASRASNAILGMVRTAAHASARKREDSIKDALAVDYAAAARARKGRK